MLKIGDFSKFSLVSIKTLRYYDDIGLLKPVKVDQMTGYRYYSAEQLPRLNRIVGLKNLGLSLEEISRIMIDNLPAEQVINLLRVKLRESQERLTEEENRLKRVQEWLRKVEKEGIMPTYDVVIKKVEAMTIASIRDTIPSYGEVGRLWSELFPYLGKQRAQFLGPPLAIYHDAEYREKDADVEAAIPIMGTVSETAGIKVRQLPAVEQMACLIHKGPYENFNHAYTALMTWVESNGYQIIGPNREIYIQGPGQGDPSTYITEIQLPVKKK